MSQKARYQDPAQRRLYPIATFNSWCARPLGAALAPVMSPNQVSLLSLVTSVAGLALVAMADWPRMLIGGGLVHLGLLLDHADGQVARRQGTGSTWGMYVDMVFDRIVEVGLVMALVPAMRRPVAGPLPSLLDVDSDAMVFVALALVGAMMLWRFLAAYGDVLYLRDHLLATGRLPAPDARPRGLLERPLVPWIFNRDWVLAIWLVGIVLGQVQELVFLLLGLHLFACLEKVIVFRRRHHEPEGDAWRVLGRDYH